jgi:hypothetical protein
MKIFGMSVLVVFPMVLVTALVVVAIIALVKYIIKR